MPKYNLLRNNYPIVADPDLAFQIGLNEAIILQKFNYLITRNEENQNPKSFHDGRWWTFNSYPVWHKKYFYWWSESTVRRSINSLKKQGVIKVGNYNKAGFDKTKWYSINYDNSKLFKPMSRRTAQNDQTNYAERADGANHNDQTDTIDYSNSTTIDYNKQEQATESKQSTKLNLSQIGSYFQEKFGRLLGSSEIQLFDSFSNDISTDMAKFAIDIAKDNGANSVGYIRAIFRNWSQKQLRTLEDVKRDNQDFKSKGKLDSSNDQLDNSKNGVGDEIIDHGNGQVDF